MLGFYVNDALEQMHQHQSGMQLPNLRHSRQESHLESGKNWLNYLHSIIEPAYWIHRQCKRGFARTDEQQHSWL